MKKKWIYNGLIVVFSLVFLVCTIRIVLYYMQANKAESEIEELVQEKMKDTDGLKKDSKGVLKDYSGLLKKNKDLVGWITIPGTKINYPLMQTKKDEQFYLHRNFKKEYDANGLPFLSKESDFNDSKSNLLIYGHHMKSGMMFAHLLEYEKKEFYKKHPAILIDTLKDRRKYQVVAAYYTQILKNPKPDEFIFYEYSGHLKKKEFKKYVKNIKAKALYDTGTQVQYGEQLVSLVTCSYHVTDGRFVVVVKQA